MEEIQHDYRDRLEANAREAARIKGRIRFIGLLRLVVFVGAVAGIYLLRDAGAWVWGSVALVGIAVFLGLARVHDRWFRRKEFADCRERVIRRELALLEYRFEGIDGGDEFIDPTHDYSFDLDLFGSKSFFAYLNRSATAVGRQALARTMLSPDLTADTIRRRQAAIEELSRRTDLRIDFQSWGACSGESSADSRLLEQLAALPRFGTGRLVHRLILAIPALYLVLVVLWLAGAIAGSVIVWPFIALLAVAGVLAKRVTRLQEQLNGALASLSHYARLFEMVEQNRFESEWLGQLQRVCVDGHGSVSQRVARLRRLLGNLDQRCNFVGFTVLNGFLLWDLRQLNALNRWLDENREQLPRWLDVLAQFDALCSLATFRYNHPHYVFPRIVLDRRPVMQAEALGHPLIPRDRCVCNDVAPINEGSFQVITGANMAGKSTYLRTIGINYLLGCMGAPVCARSMTFTPLPLFTGLRASDSLADNESYFFAELKRLQQIVVRLRAGEKLFVILDEILRGTNSVDKQTGSLALVRQLVEAGAAGIIATHDLVLGQLAEKLPGQISNYRFEATIEGDELTFTYRLQPGIARNMNACFLMKKMGIIPAEASESDSCEYE